MIHTHFFKTLLGLTLLAAGSSFAQMSPVGTWHSIDDKTGEAKAEIQIVEKEGALSGRVVKSLRNDPNAKRTCDECKDDRKGQTIIGMEIVVASSLTLRVTTYGPMAAKFWTLKTARNTPSKWCPKKAVKSCKCAAISVRFIAPKLGCVPSNEKSHDRNIEPH